MKLSYYSPSIPVNTGKICRLPKDVEKRVLSKEISFEEFKEHAKPLQELIYALEFDVKDQKVADFALNESLAKKAGIKISSNPSYKQGTILDVARKGNYQNINELFFRGYSSAGLIGDKIKATIPLFYSGKEIFPINKAAEVYYIPRKPYKYEEAIELEFDVLKNIRTERSATYDSLFLDILANN